MQSLCESVHQQCRGNTDIEAFCKTVHRDLDVHVGMFQGIVGKTCFFGAENHGDRLVEWEGVKAVIILMRACGNDFITFAVKIIESFGSVELVHVVFVKVEPFA